jgi:hypothetical protein
VLALTTYDVPDPDAADPPFANDAQQNGVKD